MGRVVRTDNVLGSAPRLEGTRIGVRHVKEHVIDAGEDPFAVAAEYDLDAADVFTALAYYSSVWKSLLAQSYGTDISPGYSSIQGQW